MYTHMLPIEPLPETIYQAFDIFVGTTFNQLTSRCGAFDEKLTIFPR
jgi:hypothetical protein